MLRHEAHRSRKPGRVRTAYLSGFNSSEKFEKWYAVRTLLNLHCEVRTCLRRFINGKMVILKNGLTLTTTEPSHATRHTENSGWKLMKNGIGGHDETVNAAEAKKRWPTHAKAIDQAIAELSTLSPRSSD